MEQVQSQNPTADLLRPQQAAELQDERRRMESSLDDPDAKNKGAIRQQLRKLDRQLESQIPKPLEGQELDKSVKESEGLLDQIMDGMLTQEEMRKNPAGAVGAHLRWEKANKKRIARWKHLQLRIHAGTDDPDVANLERFRPVRRSNSLNMDTVQIPGKAIFLPNGPIKVKNVMSDSDKAELNRQTDEAMAAAGSKLKVSEPKPSKKKGTAAVTN